MSVKRKGVTKSDIVRAIKLHSNTIESINRHMMFVDDILAKFVNFLGKEDEFSEYLIKLDEEAKAKKDGEHKQPKRKRSGRSTTTSK